ncbi:MAG: isoleucine--tRNA ligase [Peptococcaceae bacterium BRH_c4a]|nr:MAG: isoleucine--tRNA ligase [Peptococcaceae bacterium BRH_c4a]
MDYSQTLNLPKTDFPMKANLPEREPEMLNFWAGLDIYGKVGQKNAGKPKFILHDGPPYANGHIHLGHTLNKVLKDIIVKYHTMSGYDSPYVPGWDTHGLPIEQQAIKAMGINRHAVHPVEFRKKCKDYALKFVDIQREEFKRLGVRGDWDNPYLTLMPHFEAAQIGVFGEMAKRGYIYKGLKPVYWCSACETALAEAEVEYAEKHSPSIYVRFPVSQGNGVIPEENTYVVIWTTTPWTLIANAAICLHPEFDYVLVGLGGDRYVVARELLSSFMEATGLSGAEVIKEMKGRDLEGVLCRHPFVDRQSLVILGEHVTLETGTGCVHTAPGHGHEDFIAGRQYKLPVISPVDGRGVFTDEAGEFAGQKYNDANKGIMEKMTGYGHLLAKGTVQHQYPHCWRCKKPVFFRATEQWFASIEGFRQPALDAIRKVRWIPAWGEERIHNMVASRGDWCISRQRTWGVPIPIFYCADCGKEIINDSTISHLQGLFREYGSDVWFVREAADLAPPAFQCPHCGSGSFTKETDIMDVWFDSGSSHLGVLEQPEIWPQLRWPADLYLEGSDQHRGWFNSSLSTSVAVRGEAPYRAVLTHGFVVDEKGRKMSKSLGNVVDPLKVIAQMGADILRLWVSSADYRSDLAVSPGILKQMTESYRKIRNTCRFLVSNLFDFDPAVNAVQYSELLEIDRWALLKLQKTVTRVLSAYRDYEFHVVYHAVHNFCAVDMSALYLDIIKDRLYTALPHSRERRSAQAVMYQVLNSLVRLLAPVLTFTSEEIWRYVPKTGDMPESIQLCDMPEINEEYNDPDLEKKWDRLLAVRAVVTRALETARKDKVIGNSLEAAAQLYASGETYELLASMEKELATIFIVSGVELSQGNAPKESVSDDDVADFGVTVARAPGAKCERCWNYHSGVGGDGEHPTLCPRCSGVVRSM